MESELARRSRLAGSLEADHFDDRRTALEEEIFLLTAEQEDELVPDDPRHFLRRRQLLHHLPADRLLANARGEILDDRKRHVRLQEREPDLSERRVEMVFGQVAFALELLEDSLDSISQRFEHSASGGRAEGYRPRRNAATRGQDGVSRLDRPPRWDIMRSLFPLFEAVRKEAVRQ